MIDDADDDVLITRQLCGAQGNGMPCTVDAMCTVVLWMYFPGYRHRRLHADTW